MFNIPNELNGLQLRQELRAAGVKITDNKEAVKVSENLLILEIDAKDYDTALSVVTNHVGIEQNFVNPEKTAAQAKLAALGLTTDDLKALGL